MKMERKQVLFAPRLVSHPVFFLFRCLFLFSSSSFFTASLSPLITITVISCSVLQMHKAKLADMFDATLSKLGMCIYVL